MKQTINLPEYLYHYTSIHSLACIIQSKTIRFTKLSNLNDPQEGKTEDLKGSENLVFCSSWTAHKQDVIPLWKMYTDLEGVRIKMPSNMFNISGDIGAWGEKKVNYAKLKNQINATAIGRINGQRFPNKVEHIFGPDEVVYDNNSSLKIVSTVFKAGENAELIDLTEVGIYKNEDWSYEKEWRFRIPYKIGFSPRFNPPISASDFCRLVEFEDNHLDVPLRQDSINSIDVMLGPCCQNSHEIIVRSLLEKYSSNYSLEKSKILIK